VALMVYVREQVARGWGVSVVCPSDGWLGFEARAAGAHVQWFDATREPGRSTLSETARFARVVEDLDPDLLHLHSSKAGLVGRLAVRGRRPTIFQPHGWSFLAGSGVTARAALQWERLASRWTGQLVCVGEGEADVGRRHGITAPVAVVPNGVDLERFTVSGPVDRVLTRVALGIDEAPTAVCVGRLSPQKGQRQLLQAWAKVTARVPGAQLVLVGDGPDEADLRAEAETLEGVRFVGVRTDVPRWLAAANVVVLPSAYEGAALAPMEAMAAGRSVVATRVEGIQESLPFECGELVAPGDVDALARAVALRLSRPALADLEGRRGHVHVQKHRDAATAARTVSQLSLSLLAAQRR
jgi:glycosyltransferase involved in cell wall biosynthesis